MKPALQNQWKYKTRYGQGAAVSYLVQEMTQLYLPQSIQYPSLIWNPQELIRSGDIVSFSAFGVAEDGVRYPYESNHVAGEGQQFYTAVVPQACVCPCLSEYNVNLVLL